MSVGSVILWYHRKERKRGALYQTEGLFKGLSNESLFVCKRKVMSRMAKGYRPDQNGTHRAQFDKNKKKIYATQTVCGICGMPVDFSYKYPHPLSPCIDHIIPIAKGGHPSDIDNLQLAHWTCNRQKSDKLTERPDAKVEEIISNRILPHTFDWKNMRSPIK